MNEQERLHLSLCAFPSPTGTFIRWPEGGFGAGPRYRTADRTHPRPPVGPYLVVRYSPTHIPELMKHNGTNFTSISGFKKPDPWEWCELILDEPVTAESEQGVQPLYSPSLGQELVNLLFRIGKRADILNWFDRSPYNNPNEGAPEE